MRRRVRPRSFSKPAIELFGYGGGGAALHHTTLASHASEVCIGKNVEHFINFWFLEGKIWGCKLCWILGKFEGFFV
jgi:hypothetical protein